MKTCLIVDDSRVVRKVLHHIAKELGFECVEAEDGRHAFESCAQSMPDVVVLDWNMPAMSGIEFLERLRGMENGKHPRVILCTTESNVAHIQRALKAGADEYIMKPFDGSIIAAKFKQLGLLGK